MHKGFTVKVGTDIVNIKRIEKALNKFSKKFIDKILTTNEADYCKHNSEFNINSVAKRFAAKEALSKAVGKIGRAHV